MLGIIFLPYTTIMHVLVWSSITGLTGWGWVRVGLGVVLDIMKWSQFCSNRKQIPGYPEGGY